MTNEIWYLEITSYRGFKHFYGRLCSRDGKAKDFCLEHVLSAAQAKLLTERDYTYEAGEISERFLLRKEVIRAGIVQFQKIEGARLLFLGSSRSAEPQTVLIGPEEFKQITNLAFRKMEALGYYSQGAAKAREATRVSDEWYAYFLEFTKSGVLK